MRLIMKLYAELAPFEHFYPKEDDEEGVASALVGKIDN